MGEDDIDGCGPRLDGRRENHHQNRASHIRPTRHAARPATNPQVNDPTADFAVALLARLIRGLGEPRLLPYAPAAATAAAVTHPSVRGVDWTYRYAGRVTA